MQELPSGGQGALTWEELCSATSQADGCQYSGVVGASPASSAALRMSDCSLGLLPAGKWTSPKGCRAARGMSDCHLRPNPPGSRPKPAGGHPLRGSRLREDTGRAEGPHPPPRVHKFLCTGPPVYIYIYIYIYIYKFVLTSERKGERNINDERESSISCLLHALYWGLSPQPEHVS
uniref:Uncharacterized protein n=1 Tax=Myotis myotis TaxID=51298 RepID=A0A7J7VYV6_MYOMY|nr:hypothetical protein mMyoMyo1_012280 [Myotis myotis]